MKTETIRKIEGKQTLDTISRKLNLTRNSAANLVSKLRKEGYLKSSGGGKQPRIYTISLKKTTEFNDGMFDILSKKTPVKIHPPFIHKTDGIYRVEDAIVDLIRLDDIRILIGVVYLFNHVRDWTYLRKKARGIEGKVGALYDFARTIKKTRKMPDKVRRALLRRRPLKIVNWLHEKEPNEMEKKWNVTVPLRGGDFDQY